MKSKKEKKYSGRMKFLIVSGISFLTILGGTLAYFTTSDQLTSFFNSALYQHTIVEKFVSPSDWTPGTTTNLTVKTKNEGSIGMAVRASFTEKWINSNGSELSLRDVDDNVVAIINFNSSWTKDSDGYYYYGSKSNMTELLTDETTSSFIDSVTFNKNVKATLNTSVSDDGQTITITSSGDGYDNARYELIIKIDTIQYDQAQNVW